MIFYANIAMYWHLLWETNPYSLIVMVFDLVLTEKTLKSVGELYLGIHVLSFGIIYTSLKFMGILYNYKVPTFVGFLQRALLVLLRKIRGRKKQTILSIKGEKMRKKSADINVEIKETIKELSQLQYATLQKYITMTWSTALQGLNFVSIPVVCLYNLALLKIESFKKAMRFPRSKNESRWIRYNQLLLDIQELKKEKLAVAQEINELAVLQRMSVVPDEPVKRISMHEKDPIGRLSMMEDHRLSMISNLEERLSIYQESILEERLSIYQESILEDRVSIYQESLHQDIEAYNQEITLTQKELEMEISLLDFDELNEKLLQLRSINMQLKSTLDGEITFTELLRREIDQLK
ncbi:hypothetical protein HDV04_004488 [Boothiomyces sp. JEL0838]|nr:hypothetical protein HDV04_004488 [Boothiomyces sp. JEL0838]